MASNRYFNCFIFILFSHISGNLIPKKDEQNGFFWQFTDIHWDLRYSVKGDVDQMCHENPNNSLVDELGKFGNYYCDSPWLLVSSSIRALKKFNPNPNFIIWTGDNIPHTDDPPPNFEVIFKTISNLTNELQSTFGKDIPIIPVLGNHDTFPQDQFPLDGRAFYSRFLDESHWNSLIPKDQWENFRNGGYFQVVINQYLSVLSLNTIIYFASNKEGNGSEDPAGQFKWIRERLLDARQGGYKVLIAAHGPPGYFERKIIVPFYNESYNDAYVDLMNEYGDVIIGHAYGHEHTDSFRIFSTSHEVNDLKGVGFIAPSVTPWHPKAEKFGSSINPSVRQYSYNSSVLLDYYQYQLNLTEANEHISSNSDDCFSTDGEVRQSCLQSLDSLWKLFYRASDAYGLRSLDKKEMLNLFRRLTQDDDLFQKYFYFNSAGVYHGYCNDSCKVSHICAISHLKIHSVQHCVNDSGAHLHTHSALDSPLTELSLVPAIEVPPSEGNSPHTMMAISVALLSLTIILSVMLVIVVMRRRKILGLGSQVTEFEWVNRHSGYRPLDVEGD